MPKESLKQGVVIAKLNKYLEWHNLPIRMNRRGVCKGLACVHAKYVLEEKEEAYFDLLKKITMMDKNTKGDEELDRLALEVAIALFPNTWDKSKHQRHSIEALQINSKNLKPSFSLGMVTNDYKWGEIFKSLKLQTDEVLLVDLEGHGINVRSIGEGKYKLYDSNYESGFKIVSGEQGLIGELHNIANQLGIKGSNLGMGVQVIRHPDKPRKERFPDLRVLYKEHIAPRAAIKNREGRARDNLYFAAANDDVVALEYIVASAEKWKTFFTEDITEAASIAVSANSPKILQKLLNLPDHEKQIRLVTLITTALIKGRKEAFDVILENPRGKEDFNEVVLYVAHAGLFINRAAVGGNVELLQYMIEQYKTSGITYDARGRLIKTPLTTQQIAEKILESNKERGDAIEAAIRSGGVSGMSHTQSVEYLFKQLKEANYTLHEKQMQDYLLVAIKTNQPHMVNLLIKEIQANMSEESQKRIMQSIHMNIPAVERTDLTILRALKNWGVTFSEVANGVIHQKENRPVGILLSIGIYLTKFSDWLNETTAKYQGLKKDMQELRAEGRSEKVEQTEEVIPKEWSSPSS